MDKEQVADRRLAFGQELRRAREARGVSLPGLAQATRIRLDFVEALEDGNFAKLPGEVFGRGFVRSIGRTLGGDTERLIELFDLAWGPSTAPQSVLKVEIKSKPTRSSNEELRIKWANAISILRRGLAFKTVVPLVAVLALAGASVFGVIRGGVTLVGRIKRSASALQQPATQQQGDQAANLRTASNASANSVSAGAASVTNQGQDQVRPSRQTVTPEVTASLVDEKSIIGTNPPSIPTPGLPKGDGAPKADELASGDARGTKPTAEFAEGRSNLSGPSGGDQQVIELVVTEPVRIRLDADQEPSVTKELTPDTYRFTFGSKADLMVYDAAALKVLFNGKSLGSLGHKGRIRRLSFQAEPLKAEKKL